MISLTELHKKHPIRRKPSEKEAFRQDILTYLAQKGIPARVETTADGKNHNLVIGDPTGAELLVGAHYDTPAASLFPNLMLPRSPILFFAYQFLPVLLILAVALGGGALIDAAGNGGDFLFPLSFLVIYYTLFFLLFRTFSNRQNKNDNTSGVAAVLLLLESLSPQERGRIAFLLFDNEEKGKKGSKAYVADHKELVKELPLINFDCVGNGRHLVFIATKGAEALPLWERLQTLSTVEGGYTVSCYPKKGSQSNSDYLSFPCGIGVMACRKTKRGCLYTPYIHTSRDTVAEEENLRYLTQLLTSVLCQEERSA